MLDTKSAGALIPGAPASKEKAKMKVRALSGFYVGGELVAPGTEIEVDEAVGHEVVGSNKAVSLEDPTPREHGVEGNEQHFEDWQDGDMQAYLRKNKVDIPNDADRATLIAACREHDQEQNEASKANALNKPNPRATPEPKPEFTRTRP